MGGWVFKCQPSQGRLARSVLLPAAISINTLSASMAVCLRGVNTSCCRHLTHGRRAMCSRNLPFLTTVSWCTCLSPLPNKL